MDLLSKAPSFNVFRNIINATYLTHMMRSDYKFGYWKGFINVRSNKTQF